jgi:hypothetical protein
VNDIEAEDERDVRPRLFDGDSLQRARRIGANDVEKGADAAPAELIHSRRTLAAARPRRVACSRNLIELPELFRERHSREHRIDESRFVATR